MRTHLVAIFTSLLILPLELAGLVIKFILDLIKLPNTVVDTVYKSIGQYAAEGSVPDTENMSETEFHRKIAVIKQDPQFRNFSMNVRRRYDNNEITEEEAVKLIEIKILSMLKNTK